jgi:hypothetical protein
MEESAAAAAPPGKKQQANESLDVSAPPVKLAKYKSLVRRQSEAIAALKQQVARLKRGERDQQSTNDPMKKAIGTKGKWKSRDWSATMTLSFGG